MRNVIIFAALAGLLGCATPLQSQTFEPEVPSITAKISSASMITHDLEASIDFYTQYLGYKVLGQKEITSEKSRKVLGALGSETVRYASLGPANWSKDRPDFAGISFAEIKSAAISPFDQDSSRSSRAGELILAHRVTNIEEISRRMIADGVPIITPLSKSGSGRSMSMAVLDPNGIRVEMYEY